ncbi:hypothetical protein YA0729_05895, partial [Pseudomonas simiae]|uniref:hypothetical protein n=1 Tax=Pseudomonas simiae TaxID=321846 RepID=UPI0018E5DC3B
LGLEVLNTLTDEEVEKARTVHPYGYMAYASLLATAKINGLHSYNHNRFISMAPITLKMPEVIEYVSNNVNNALLMI